METDLLALIDEGCAQCDCNVRFASPCSTYKNQVMGIGCKLAGAQLFDLRFLHSRYAIIKRCEVLMMGEL